MRRRADLRLGALPLLLVLAASWMASVRAACVQNDAQNPNNFPAQAYWPNYGRYTKLDSGAGADDSCA